MLSAKQRGKHGAAAADDDDGATQATTQDSRWRAGVNRQAQAQAQQHQVAASQAAAAKRTASAMTVEERKVKRAARARELYAQQAAKRAVVAEVALLLVFQAPERFLSPEASLVEQLARGDSVVGRHVRSGAASFVQAGPTFHMNGTRSSTQWFAICSGTGPELPALNDGAILTAVDSTKLFHPLDKGFLYVSNHHKTCLSNDVFDAAIPRVFKAEAFVERTVVADFDSEAFVIIDEQDRTRYGLNKKVKRKDATLYGKWTRSTVEAGGRARGCQFTLLTAEGIYALIAGAPAAIMPYLGAISVVDGVTQRHACDVFLSAFSSAHLPVGDAAGGVTHRQLLSEFRVR